MNRQKYWLIESESAASGNLALEFTKFSFQKVISSLKDEKQFADNQSYYIDKSISISSQVACWHRPEWPYFHFNVLRFVLDFREEHIDVVNQEISADMKILQMFI